MKASVRYATGSRSGLIKSMGGIVVAGVLSLPTAWAGGVVTNCTEAALRAAMAGGGEVRFACDGTIVLASTLTNLADTVLDGSGHQVTISGGDAVRVLWVPTNVSLGVVNLTIAHGLGRMGGGILNSGGRVSLSGVQMLANRASYAAEPEVKLESGGGGILNLGGEVAATNCAFSGNQVLLRSAPGISWLWQGGGALCNHTGPMRLENCLFWSNSVTRVTGWTSGRTLEATGGAIANSGTLEAGHCTFLANSVLGSDGGIDAYTGGDACGGAVCNRGLLDLSNGLFQSNSVSGGVGGIGRNAPVGYIPVTGDAGETGGAAYGGGLFNAGAATIASSTFLGNTARGGTGGTGGAGSDASAYPPEYHAVGGDGGTGGTGGSACGAVFDANALCFLTNCTLMFNAGFPGAGGAGGWCGLGNPCGSDGAVGSAGEALGCLQSIGCVVMNTVLTGNAPANCSGPFTDGGQNMSGDCSCAFTNSTPNPGLPPKPPFYVVHQCTDLSTYNRVESASHPFGPLAVGAGGGFYGVTAGIPYPADGVVYQVHTNGTDSSFVALQTLRNLSGGVVLSADVLYGVTLTNVFKLNTDGSGYQVLHTFNGTGDGRKPLAGLVLGGSLLFGTTDYGGVSNAGTVFRIDTNGAGYCVIHEFLGGTNGLSPAAELALSDTTLYGTTCGGGQLLGGTVFRIETNGSGFKVLKHFDPASWGGHPGAGTGALRLHPLRHDQHPRLWRRLRLWVGLPD